MRIELDSLLEQEELFWAQRAKQHWLVLGDSNTMFFHSMTKARRARNHIWQINSLSGALLTDESSIRYEFHNHFKSFYSSAPFGPLDPLQSIVPYSTLSVDQLASLNHPFQAWEVKQALFQMAPLKAPGPDGIPPIFYQKSWPEISVKLTSAVLSFLNSGRILREINKTFLALIPKNNNPTSVDQFRPISLCNVLYKLISKVLANRIKLVIGSLVSPFQNGFLPGRVITDNISIAQELTHFVRNKKQGSDYFASIKLDMSKDFDRIRWDFLEQVLHLYGFPSHWIQLLMQCVTTVSYSVLVNGSCTPFFHPSQGLRQGDPLSPYLFVLCVDILSSMIGSAHSQGLIEGIQASTFGPSITHLLFADDSFLFLKVSTSGITTIQSILDSYCQLSGQMVNFQKSIIFLGPNSPPSLYASISSSLLIPLSPFFGKYLGINLDLTSKKREIFQDIITKIDDKCQGWVSLLLNKAGRLSLLKYILTSLLVYHMSCLKFPIYVTKKISSILSNFLWSGASNKKIFSLEKLGLSLLTQSCWRPGC